MVTPEVRKNAMQMSASFKPVSGCTLIPLDPHRGSPVFNTKRLQAYIDNDNFTEAGQAYTEEVKGSSFSEFSTDLESKVAVSGSGGLPAGASVSGSVSAEMGLSSTGTKSYEFVQHRKLYLFGSVQLPSPGIPVCFTQLQELMEPSMLEYFNSAKTPQKAEDLVEEMGAFYVSQAWFGALFTLSACMEKTSQSSVSHLSTSVSASYGSLLNSASATASIKVKGSSSGESMNATVTKNAVGGNPMLVADEERWNDAARANPIIVKVKLMPIFSLVEKTTPQYECLVQAVYKYLKKHASLLADLDAKASKETVSLLNGTFSWYNIDGNRHPNKYVHIRDDGWLQAYGPMDSWHTNDGNRHFVIKPHKVIRGEQTYLIYNTDGSRHPNKYVHIRDDGHLQAYGPMDSWHTEDGNRHFVIKPYKVIRGHQTYTIFNVDGSRHPNKYVHIRDDGHVQAYGPMDSWHTEDGNRHFVLEPWP